MSTAATVALVVAVAAPVTLPMLGAWASRHHDATTRH